jgi:sigma-B regulation protein RsbU (phosphoserine phosphatase)
MPEMTGYELCSAVKEDPELRAIPFILLSTLSEPRDIIRGLHCGADNYVTKPYDPDFLIARTESLLTTPLGDSEDVQKLDVTLAGESYTVNSSSQQVLNLLVSTFENAVEKNNELITTNQELTLAKEQLTVWNQKLEELNGKLEQANGRMSRDLNAAAKVQQSLLPLDDKHIAAFVVDVSGHGVASSLLSVTIGRLLTPHETSSSLLLQSVEGSDKPRVVPPLEVAQELNRRFQMGEQNGLYFTMAYGILNIETLEFRHVSAGHPPLVHVSKSGSLTTLENWGMAIGWVDEIECSEHVIQLDRGDRLYLYSDGVPEAMNPESKQFGNKQMLEVMELGKRQPLNDSVMLLLDVVQRWGADGSLKDDVSILGMEIAG